MSKKYKEHWYIYYLDSPIYAHAFSTHPFIFINIVIIANPSDSKLKVSWLFMPKLFSK